MGYYRGCEGAAPGGEEAMTGVSVTVTNARADARGAMQREIAASNQRAALAASAQAAKDALGDMRRTMQAAGLGRLGYALGTGSDLEKGTIKKTANGFSASGYVFTRSGSERSRGALESYLKGSEIRPAKGRFLWIATDEIQRLAGKGRDRTRVTPATYKEFGLEQKVGPLVLIRSVNGNPLLVVKGASVSASGKARSARARTKTGRLRKGQREKEFIVAFIGIPRTSRKARIDADAIFARGAARVPELLSQSMARD